jgi:hypothetical protein
MCAITFVPCIPCLKSVPIRLIPKRHRLPIPRLPGSCGLAQRHTSHSSSNHQHLSLRLAQMHSPCQLPFTIVLLRSWILVHLSQNWADFLPGITGKRLFVRHPLNIPFESKFHISQLWFMPAVLWWKYTIPNTSKCKLFEQFLSIFMK